MGNAYFTRDELPNAIIGTFPEGHPWAGSLLAVVFQINPILGFFAASVYIQWCWGTKLDIGFTGIGGWSIDSSDAAAVERIMRSGGHWDASWQRLASGEDYYNSPIDHQQYEGIAAVSRRMTDWLIGQSVYNAELATNSQWMPQFMAEQQANLDNILTTAVKPPERTPPHPAWEDWHPSMVGQISDAITLELAQTTRMTLVPGAGKLVFDKIAIPT